MRAAIVRRRQEVDHRVEKRLHALVLEGGTAEDGMELAADHRLADQLAQALVIRLLAVEIGRHRVVVELDARLDELRAVFRRLILEIVGDIDVVELGAEGFLLPDDALHAHEIDDALEALSAPIGS